MNGEQIVEFVPQLMSRWPNAHRRTGDLDPNGWIIEPEGAYAYISPKAISTPFIMVKVGLATDIAPARRLDIAAELSQMNQAIVVGRIYDASPPETSSTLVLEEMIFAEYLSYNYEPSLMDMVNRIETALGHGRNLGPKLIARFGGRPFGGEDWLSVLV